MIAISARTRTTLSIHVKNPEAIESYIPRIRLHDGIYLGETIVTNRKSKAYIGIIAKEKDLEYLEYRIDRVSGIKLQEIVLLEVRSPF